MTPKTLNPIVIIIGILLVIFLVRKTQLTDSVGNQFLLLEKQKKNAIDEIRDYCLTKQVNEIESYNTCMDKVIEELNSYKIDSPSSQKYDQPV